MSKSRKRRARRNRRRRDPNADLYDSDDEDDRQKVVLTPESNWRELQYQAYLRMRMRQGMIRKNDQEIEKSGRTVSLAERIVRFRILNTQGNADNKESPLSEDKAGEKTKLQDLLQQYIQQRQAEEALSSELMTEINVLKSSLQEDELISNKGRQSQSISLGDSATDFNRKVRNRGVNKYLNDEDDRRHRIGTGNKDTRLSASKSGKREEGHCETIRKEINVDNVNATVGYVIQTKAEVHRVPETPTKIENENFKFDPNHTLQPSKSAISLCTKDIIEAEYVGNQNTVLQKEKVIATENEVQTYTAKNWTAGNPVKSWDIQTSPRSKAQNKEDIEIAGTKLDSENTGSVDKSDRQCSSAKKVNTCNLNVDEEQLPDSKRSTVTSSVTSQKEREIEKEENQDKIKTLGDAPFSKESTVAITTCPVLNDSGISESSMSPAIASLVQDETAERGKAFIITNNEGDIDLYIKATENAKTEDDSLLLKTESNTTLNDYLKKENPSYNDSIHILCKPLTTTTKSNIVHKMDLPDIYIEERDNKVSANNKLDSLENKIIDERDSPSVYLPSLEQEEIRKRRDIYLQHATTGTIDNFYDYFDSDIEIPPCQCQKPYIHLQGKEHIRETYKHFDKSMLVTSRTNSREDFENEPYASCVKNNNFHLPLLETTNKRVNRDRVSKMKNTLSLLPQIHASSLRPKPLVGRVNDRTNRLRGSWNAIPSLLDHSDKGLRYKTVACSHRFSRNDLYPMRSESSEERETRITSLYRKLKKFDALQGHHELAEMNDTNYCCRCYMKMWLEWGFMAAPKIVSTKARYGLKGLSYSSFIRANSSCINTPVGPPSVSKEIPGRKNDFIYLRDISFSRFVHKSISENRVGAYLNPLAEKGSEFTSPFNGTKSQARKARMNGHRSNTTVIAGLPIRGKNQNWKRN